MLKSNRSIAWQGDGYSDQLTPGKFMREIDNKIGNYHVVTEARKVNCLRNNIAYGSLADDWFNKLGGGQKDTYEVEP
jgi:hypothetical protein